jgi:predicted cobalt transporter CbtA
MMRSLLLRGLLTGAVAGLAAAVVAFALGEPQLERAIRWEHARAAGAHVHDDALVSRGVQRTAGLATGTIATGTALGGLLALAFALVYGRVGPRGARATAALLAVGAFVGITLVPFLAHPPNPPGVGEPATIGERTTLHLATIAIAFLAVWAGLRTRRAALDHGARRTATFLGAGTCVVVVAAAAAALPAPEAIPRDFPTGALSQFRLASLATNAVLWAVLGLGFGVAATRCLKRASVRSAG